MYTFPYITGRGFPGEEDVMAGRPKKAEKRTESLVVRLTPKEVKMARELAGRKGKTVSEWIREQIYDAPEKDAANLWRMAREPRTTLVEEVIRSAQEPRTFTLKNVARPAHEPQEFTIKVIDQPKQEPQQFIIRKADIKKKGPKGKRKGKGVR
jgi:hypothetical protein